MRRQLTVVEVGPVGVHRTGSEPGELPDELVQAALDCIDDQYAIVDDRLVGVDDIWARVLGTSGYAVVVHPTWWTPNRVDRIRDAATACGIERVASRAEVLGTEATDDSWAVIEISADLVSVTCNDVGTQSWTRCGRSEDAVVDAVAGTLGDSRDVMIDVPADVPGGRSLARALADRVPCRYVSPVDAVRRARTDDRPAERKRRGRKVAVGVSAAAAAALCALLAAYEPRGDTATTALVEGRVAVRIPAGWQVQRVTEDAGSPRLQVFSPAEPDAVIHITQSPVGAGDVADTLRHALDHAPAGVFVDFDPSDRIADRPVITYREVRAHREVRWAVLVDGPVRIAIGCQSPEFHPVCVAAVASARAAF
ncbi:type VII secretion-associated protein [Mycolicibacterium goodii]|uniref:Type VII secretion-associated protein n=1 Tax=Mycolicibacterium goodii TaxID=134601 RepID=A0ABS6HGJ0_MYCGD|nr:type VII secretion-associated protein [Mycolicibacterium goodii]MBU8821794.1 type VII secretion-associated protein [Mycolicibacterium goodii]MBU8836786.1 type VII secretion-associated protein [Mycolicibacterium goodii]